ncbi:MAG TPA: sn-glycerol-3-phosphate ABC transporter ATP-binding protein UgpC [Gemmatimonadaceae bacterium]|nr:sn-glycerol-3-phosphate ABC transporter ATP-binding protein UgpC [Gemmatimonadaceae bacterium]
MASVGIRDVRKAFGTTQVIHGVDISIGDGEFVVLVGPSGCGKSTLLRMIAGLENITGGEIRIGERVVNHVPPKERDIAMVFQNYALYPHMTVAANMGFSLKLRGAPKTEIDERVDRAAAILGLKPLLERFPRQLSGGQRQRVAMGRAIVRDPQVFLFDEPLSNLDAKLRVAMRTEIKELHQRLQTTTVYVTHDQIEAMTMGNRVAVMRKGELQQVDEPQTLYDRPVNIFVGGFIGSPAMNMLEATLEQTNGTLTAVAGTQRVHLDEETLNVRPALSNYVGRRVILGIRPEDIEDAALLPDSPTDRRLTGHVELREALGSEIMVHFRVDASAAETEDTRELQEDVHGGAEAAESAPQSGEHGAIIVGRFGARSHVREDQNVEAAVDTRALHFFDPDSGLGIYEGKTKGAA